MYSRFTALQNYNEEDQDKLDDSIVAVVGLGATGSAIAENLARHGVNLILIDRDYLEEKDVYSSSLYDIQQCERSLPKVEAAKEKLSDKTEVQEHSISLKPENINILESADIILDGTDNIETRQLINDYSKKENIPWIYTAAIAERAYSMPFTDECFNCMVQKPEKVATCETDGIMREIAQIAAAKSSMKAVQILTEREVDDELEIIHQSRSLQVKSSGCEVCKNENYPHLNSSNSVSTVCGSGKYQLERNFSKENLDSINVGEKVAENDYLVRIDYEGRDVVFFESGRIIVEAEDEGHAEATVSEIMGI